MAFQELMETGGAEETKELRKLQNELQSDDPINIQFTSVSNTGKPAMIMVRQTWRDKSGLY